MNQSRVYIHPLRSEPPSHLPPHSTPLGRHRAPHDLPASYKKFPLAILGVLIAFTLESVFFLYLFLMSEHLQIPYVLSLLQTHTHTYLYF